MSDNDNILSEEQMYQTYEVARAVNVVNTKVDVLKRMVDRHVHWDHGEESLREKMLALCEKWECVAETPSDPADVHGDEDRDRTRVLEDEYRWRGDYLRQMWADFAEAVCYMHIGPATPEALAWGRKKMDELGLGEGGQAADGEGKALTRNDAERLRAYPNIVAELQAQVAILQGDSATLRAERDALQAKGNKHEKEMIDYIEAAAAMYQRRTADLRAERDAAQARVAELEAALREAVEAIRSVSSTSVYGDCQYWPRITGAQLRRLRAALGEESSDAH